MRKTGLASLIVLFAAATAQAGTLNTTASGFVRDSSLNGSPDTAFGAGVPVQVVNSTYYGKEDRGVAEFDISGFSSPVLSAQLDVTADNFLHLATTTYAVYGYAGDGSVGLSDWSSGALIDTFSVGAQGASASVDITSQLNSLISAGTTYAGFRIVQSVRTADSGFATFGRESVTATPTITYTQGATAVPLPGAAWMGLGLFVALGAVRRARRRSRGA